MQNLNTYKSTTTCDKHGCDRQAQYRVELHRDTESYSLIRFRCQVHTESPNQIQSLNMLRYTAEEVK